MSQVIQQPEWESDTFAPIQWQIRRCLGPNGPILQRFSGDGGCELQGHNYNGLGVWGSTTHIMSDNKTIAAFKKEVAELQTVGQGHADALVPINEKLVGWGLPPIKLKKVKKTSTVPEKVLAATKEALADGTTLNITGWKKVVIQKAGYFDDNKLADFRAALVAEGIVEVVKDAVGTGKTIKLIEED